MQHHDLTREKLLQTELVSLVDEGCQDSQLLKDIKNALGKETGHKGDPDLWQRIDQANQELLLDPKEPSGIESIQAVRKNFLEKDLPEISLSKDELEDKVLGAWQARCAGCTLGKPVENWPREKIRRYLQAAGAYPLHSYIPAMPEFPQGLELWDNYTGTTLGSIERMVRDDDIDYTVLGLKTLETYGRDFTSLDIGKLWLENLPFNSIFTAEVIAYRNMVNEMDPPRTASFRNPYREFIGAQIRADMWGYVNPGDPQAAAEMAWRDASLSHTKNGIYGEMWAAACIAAAYVLEDPREVILSGLGQIPAESRLVKAVLQTMDWCGQAGSWEEVVEKIEAAHASMSSIHVINNTCLIVMGLMMGKLDMGESLCIALMGGLDTDCTCATTGSMLGAMLGARGLPVAWIDPLNDQLHSMINGFEISSISDLSRRTCQHIS